MDRRLLLGLAVVAGLAGAGGARGATLADVVANGESLAGRTVTVDGRVADPKLQFAGETTYTLTDGTKRLAVFGKAPAPAKGQHLQVTGTVGFKEGDEEFTWPPILYDATWQTAP